MKNYIQINFNTNQHTSLEKHNFLELTQVEKSK